MLTCPGLAAAQGINSWLGSTSWFDWSDFRGKAEGRFFLARLTSGTITTETNSYDLRDDLGFTDDIQMFREFRFTAYLDRIGFHVFLQGDQKFLSSDNTIPDFVVSPTSLGLDLDLVRHHNFAFGINYDYHLERIRIVGNFTYDGNAFQLLDTERPMTLGVHARIIPFRFKDVPVIAQARFRFPVPFLNRSNEPLVYDWEVSAGLRPTVWETSLYGHTTFSVGIEGGYRSINFDVENDVPDGNWRSLKATWQGAFVQISVTY
jgi:hypothetical protein